MVDFKQVDKTKKVSNQTDYKEQKLCGIFERSRNLFNFFYSIILHFFFVLDFYAYSFENLLFIVKKTYLVL